MTDRRRTAYAKIIRGFIMAASGIFELVTGKKPPSLKEIF